MFMTFDVGVHRGNHHIAAELIASLLHASTRGSATRSNAFVDTVLNLVGWASLAEETDRHARLEKHHQEHKAYLKSKGFTSGSK
ncbi:hypothetical protein EDD16DRAFT_1700735 [Pisolithus croceorrhizus]|nr:hypothetical protein EDD16DRAFT_1700735 [Pisolithus croceorrhizus]